MTKQISVKALCACGEEVTEKDLKTEIRTRLLYAITHCADERDVERIVESMYDLVQESYVEGLSDGIIAKLKKGIDKAPPMTEALW